ncbi:VWA domain-containing protein [uncultured Treponema sp.]|uniref:vWA domain-containing protein n=1 Tax=uncultured Treponema sp. TaxID=162155 RepID=UPI00258F009E|nr:VWA domain-containing protein [uncultured Treponema sp.]
MAFDPSKYTVAKAKPLPVVLLLDTSSSMNAGGEQSKIAELDSAVRDMIKDFAHEEQLETEIQVSVITFGYDGVKLALPYTNASKVEMKKLEAQGNTPMGTALRMAKDMIEDKETTPSRAYRPLVILCSDGAPNDDWEAPMDNFIKDGRSSKCDRMAMAIGSDANEAVLKRFIEVTENPLFYAKDASSMHKFFKFVTMSVATRSHSQNPNVIMKIEPPKEIVEPVAAIPDTGSYW